MRTLPLLLCLALLAASSCKKERARGTAGTGAKPARSAPPPPTQPPIRENAVRSPASEGVVTELRALVSTVATGEPLQVALRFAPAVAPARKDPWYHEQFSWAEAASGLRFQIVAPGGKKHELVLSETARKPTQIAFFVGMLRITSSGIGDWKWKDPPPDLLSTVGEHQLTISGEVKTSRRTFAIATPPLRFSIAKHGPDHKTIEELESLAAAAIAKSEKLASPPKPAAPTIDDENGSRWLRFTLRDRSEHYDVHVVELLLDPTGKELFRDDFQHFTCVATGTPIATPSGSVRVETLRVGDVVTSYDVVARARSSARVVAIQSSHAERLHAIGSLRLTPHHPVWADGRWVPAGEVRSGATLLGVSEPKLAVSAPVVEPTTVYELSVEAPHTYFAADVLVHNKIAHVPIGPDTPFRGWFYRRAAKTH